MDGSRRIILPSGKVFDLQRPRSDGILGLEELEYCRRADIPIGYDCMQCGWIALTGEDDLLELFTSDSIKPEIPAAADLERAVMSLRSSFMDKIRIMLDEVDSGLCTSAVAEKKLWDAADNAADELAARFDLVAADRGRGVLRNECANALARIRGSIGGERTDSVQPRLSFRKWELSDAGRYVHLLGNPNVWKYLPETCPTPFTEQTARDLIQVSWLESHHEVLAVEIDGEPVGQCRLRFDKPCAGMHAAEADYWLGEEYWGKGWMSSVLRVFTKRGFEKHPLDLIYLWIFAENQASIRVAERVGYRRDTFKGQEDVFRALKKPGAVRYVYYRADMMGAPRS
jgi:[ribosomal protein S5]-alanine N-acetyltransferase